MKNNLIAFLLLMNIFCPSFQNEDYIENYEDVYFNDPNFIHIISISYELTYNDYSIIKVIIKTYNEIMYDINFEAYLKSEEEEKKYILHCKNTFLDTIECYTDKNITFNIEDKFYFYYEKGDKGKITFDGHDKYEDSKRISLVFKPSIVDNQHIYKDKRTISIHLDDDMINGGYLYIVRKSKNILQKPKDGFNKYIDLNNLISHAGLYSQLPQSSLIAFEEAIRRGFHIVDADLIFSKDKVPVICHGKNLASVSDGYGEIPSKTLEELEKLDFGSKFNEKYRGEKILTFEKLLKLCKENNVIIDLDLAHLEFEKYFLETDEYIKIIFGLIEKYNMSDSIFFNDARMDVIKQMKKIKNDVSFSVSDMNKMENIEKVKDEFKGSKRIIYNMGGLSTGKTINEETVKYVLSLGSKIKAAKVDDLKFAEKIFSWGVNYITTNSLHPFIAKNDKEDPILVRCCSSVDVEFNSECEIDERVKLIDNEIYSIYYSDNIYNISEDINEEPIGEFKYIDTNILKELYYEINDFNYDKGIIKLRMSNKIKRYKTIRGVIGPAYDNVAECYQLNFICRGNGSHNISCKSEKNEDKIKVNLNYSIYSVEGYSLNPKEVRRKLFFKKKLRQLSVLILIIDFLLVGKIIVDWLFKKRKNEEFKKMKIDKNNYISDIDLFK